MARSLIPLVPASLLGGPNRLLALAVQILFYPISSCSTSPVLMVLVRVGIFNPVSHFLPVRCVFHPSPCFAVHRYRFFPPLSRGTIVHDIYIVARSVSSVPPVPRLSRLTHLRTIAHRIEYCVGAGTSLEIRYK
jgi:hypothetical protein